MRSWPGHRSCWPGTATRPPAAASSFLNAAGRLGGWRSRTGRPPPAGDRDNSQDEGHDGIEQKRAW